MPTGDYILNNKKLPSATQIIGRFKNAIGLNYLVKPIRFKRFKLF